MDKIPYAKIFGPPRDLGRVLAPDDFSYDMDPPADLVPGSIVLHVACNTLTVPHIPYLAQKIMERVGIEFATVGGPENCCGAPQWANGDDALERQVATLTLNAFRQMKPVQVVSTCPDCDTHFQLYRRRQHTFQHMNLVEMLGEHLDKLKTLMRFPVERRVALHLHEEGEGRRKDAESVRRIMSVVPGLEVVKAKNSNGLGNHCLVNIGRYRSTISPETTDAMFSELQEKEVDSLIVPYHGCYRQHCKRQLEYGVEVQHYLEIIAQSMGIEFEDTFKELRMLDDVDAAMDRLRPRIKEMGYREDDIRSMVQSAIYA